MATETSRLTWYRENPKAMYNVFSNKRGPRFYKFNSSLLENRLFLYALTDIIIRKKEEYKDISDERIAWDRLKFDIQCKSIEMGIKILF